MGLRPVDPGTARRKESSGPVGLWAWSIGTAARHPVAPRDCRLRLRHHQLRGRRARGATLVLSGLVLRDRRATAGLIATRAGWILGTALNALFQFNAKPRMHKRCLWCALDNFHPDATRCR